MRKIRKKRRKKQKQILIISTLSLLLCLCVGYAAFQTSINITAKGNIVEKAMTPEDLKALVVNSGDGLYADEYEMGRYIYKGSSPNNYIIFNNEMWRILSVEKAGVIKIIKDGSIGTMYWNSEKVDGKNYNDWENSTLQLYLNNEFLSSITEDTYIVSHDFSVGMVIPTINLNEQIDSENSVKWKGMVGLITVSEYIRATSNTQQCGNINSNNNNVSICRESNWLFNYDISYWTINGHGLTNNLVYFIYTDGGISSYGTSNTTNGVANEKTQDVRPVVYLKSDIKLLGTGESSNPYVIVS